MGESAAPVPARINPANRPQWSQIAEAFSRTAEPAKNISRVSGIVSAGIVIAAAVGLPIDDDTRNALITLGVALLPVFEIVGRLIRARVVPVEKANAVIEAAYKMQPTAGETPPAV